MARWTDDKIMAQVISVIIDVTNLNQAVAEADISLDTVLSDVGLEDGLDLVELVMALEESFDVTIDEDEIAFDSGDIERSPEKVIRLNSRFMQFDTPDLFLTVGSTVGDVVGLVRDRVQE